MAKKPEANKSWSRPKTGKPVAPKQDMSRNLINHATRALETALSPSGAADAKLSAYFRENNDLGMNDRAFIADAVYAVLRRKRYLMQICGSEDPFGLLMALMLRVQGLGLRELSAQLSPVQTTRAQEIKAAVIGELSPAVQADLPDWLWDSLAEQYGAEQALTLARSLQQPAPLDLRVNRLNGVREAVLALFEKEGIAAEATSYSPDGVRLKNKIALNKHVLFTKGVVEVQDEGSQLLALLVAPKRGEMVADFCAGAGGKTLALGALMANTGRLYAFDVSERRLSNLKPRLARSGLSNIHPQLIANERDQKLKRLAGKFDRVLVDAPCSGLGTLRRNPDLRWRQSPRDISELVVKQTNILAAAAKLVKTGGRLVYATCSLLQEENREIVDAFLSAHPDFKLLNAAELLAQQHVALDTGETLTLLPQVHGTDGFFAAAMTREN
ncbi:MAG: RsmB/NOP family class I SAM-dependent RNA methyltransferase [Methylophilaceae bacterium]